MSRPFTKYSAKPTFAQFNEPLVSNEYINRKRKNNVCSAYFCQKNKNLNSQSNYLFINNINNSRFKTCKNTINKSQLYINLITKLDLSSNISGETIPVISDLSYNTSPVIINDSVIPFLTYNIDPSGYLFGNSPCGINNFENYIVYNHIKKYIVYI